MFEVAEFVMVGLKDAIGKLTDYQIIFKATDYFQNGVLSEENLKEINKLIELKNNPVEEVAPEIIVEEESEELTDD